MSPSGSTQDEFGHDNGNANAKVNHHTHTHTHTHSPSHSFSHLKPELHALPTSKNTYLFFLIKVGYDDGNAGAYYGTAATDSGGADNYAGTTSSTQLYFFIK